MSYYQVAEAEGPFAPIEAHGCCRALCLLWLPLWAARSHGRLPTKCWTSASNSCTSRFSCQASLLPPVAGAQAHGREVLGSTAAGAADGRPWSWSLGPSNPGEASAHAVDAQLQHPNSWRTSSTPSSRCHFWVRKGGYDSKLAKQIACKLDGILRQRHDCDFGFIFEPWPGEKEHLMALPGSRRCGHGSRVLSKSPLDKRDHGPKHQGWSLHIFKAFDETYEAKRPRQSTTMLRESLVGAYLERCAFGASEARIIGKLCGALARRPLWDTRTPAFHICSGSQNQRFDPLNYHPGFSNFQFLVEPLLFPGSIPGWINTCLFVLFWAAWNLEGVKAACLKVLGDETARLRPADLEPWIISLLFQEVDVLDQRWQYTCRSLLNSCWILLQFTALFSVVLSSELEHVGPLLWFGG